LTTAPAADPAANIASPLQFKVGELLDGLGKRRASYWPPILLGLVMLFDSWDAVAIAYGLPSIAKEWGLKPAAMGALISSGYIGQFIGAIVISAVAERLGRMPVILTCVAVMGVLALGSAFAPDQAILMAVRFAQGLAIGGALPVCVTYINELAPSATRGRYFSIFQFLYLTGFATASLASTVIVPQLGWRWLLGAGGTPLLLLPLVIATLPESPRWLATTGRTSKLPAALARLGCSLPAADLPAGDIAPHMRPARIPVSSLFTARYRWLTITLIVQWFLTMFVNLGMTTWIPSIFVTVYKIPLASSLLYAAIASTGFKIMIPFIALFIDRYGRRPLPIIGCLLGALILFALALADVRDVNLLVPIVITGMLCCNIGSFMVWPYSAEVYPTHIRAVGLGLCSATARAATTLTPLFVGLVLGAGGTINLVYGAFGLFSLISCLLWIFATPETAGRRLETI